MDPRIVAASLAAAVLCAGCSVSSSKIIHEQIAPPTAFSRAQAARTYLSITGESGSAQARLLALGERYPPAQVDLKALVVAEGFVLRDRRSPSVAGSMLNADLRRQRAAAAAVRADLGLPPA